MKHSPHDSTRYLQADDRYTTAEGLAPILVVAASTVTKHARAGVLLRRTEGFHVGENVRLYVRHLEGEALARTLGWKEQ